MSRSSNDTAAQPTTAALFVSDIHLQASLPCTAAAFVHFLNDHARHTKQLYLLGDLFEAWAGDDDIGTPFNRGIVNAIRQVSDAGASVFWIAGNRDFLIGPQFASAAGLTLLPDPSLIQHGNHRIILTHGDTCCTDDIGYMAFRQQVRNANWQAAFLARPLAERQTIIRDMRAGSRAEQRSKSSEMMDVNASAIAQLFDASHTSIMIHGHTHRTARHTTPHASGERVRYVLPDWDCDAAEPARGGWIALDEDGTLHRMDINNRELN